LHNFIEKKQDKQHSSAMCSTTLRQGQGLLNYFLRALNCGAITEEEALASGLTLDELSSRSFVKIMKGRREVR